MERQQRLQAINACRNSPRRLGAAGAAEGRLGLSRMAAWTAARHCTHHELSEQHSIFPTALDMLPMPVSTLVQSA